MGSRKSENFHFDAPLSKAYKVLDEKVQSYVSWHWRLIKSLKKNWLLVPKMTWGISWILMRAVTSLKICTLMGLFCPKHIKYKRFMSHNTEEWFKEKLLLEKYVFFVWCNRFEAVNGKIFDDCLGGRSFHG